MKITSAQHNFLHRIAFSGEFGANTSLSNSTAQSLLGQGFIAIKGPVNSYPEWQLTSKGLQYLLENTRVNGSDRTKNINEYAERMGMK
jgi:hypothetical protein